MHWFVSFSCRLTASICVFSAPLGFYRYCLPHLQARHHLKVISFFLKRSMVLGGDLTSCWGMCVELRIFVKLASAFLSPSPCWLVMAVSSLWENQISQQAADRCVGSALLPPQWQRDLRWQLLGVWSWCWEPNSHPNPEGPQRNEL